MGQRHQIYVMVEDNTTQELYCVGAFHHQWLYGMGAYTNLHRFVALFEAQSYKQTDPRIINTMIKAVYGVSYRDMSISMVHDETDCDYLIDKETRQITPENGDNNDGCTLFIINPSKNEIRAGFFTPGYCEGNFFTGAQAKPWKAWKAEKYLSFYYSKENLNDPEFLEAWRMCLDFCENVEVKPITQKDLFKACIIKEELKHA
jgi:hypothetical protein